MTTLAMLLMLWMPGSVPAQEIDDHSREIRSFPRPHDHQWTWAEAPGASGYRVYAAEPGGNWILVSEAPTPTTRIHVSSIPGDLVLLTVTAFNDFGESPIQHPTCDCPDGAGSFDEGKPPIAP